MRAISLSLLACLALAWGGGASVLAAEQASDLAEADRGTFASADLNGDGKITRGEIVHFTDLVFLSMDSDGDGSLTLKEFLAWDTGYVYAAKKMGKAEDIADVKEEIFKELDLNKDGAVDHPEMSAATLYHFYKADTDRDRALSQKEFFEEFYIIKTLREPLD